MTTGHFITIEGIEGVGKSTARSHIEQWMNDQQIDCVMTREPGGTPISEAIRTVLLAKHEEPMTHDTELLLMFAGRAQHLHSVIKPALARGQVVVSDRFTDASYAYQGAGRGVDAKRIETLEQWVQGELRPDYILLLDAPVEVAMSRIQSRGELDRFESEQVAFFERIRQCYLQRAKDFPDKYIVVDASHDVDTVNEQLDIALSHILLESDVA